MKKVILLLVVIFGMVSCHSSKEVKESQLKLLNTTARVSSLKYLIEIEKYMVKHKTNTISLKSLDSIKLISDKRCETVILSAVEKIK
jgi:hypothetical protein